MGLNGTNLLASTSQPAPPLSSNFNDNLLPHTNGFEETPVEILERELPVVHDGQVHLGEVMSRVVQACYAELTEMAET